MDGSKTYGMKCEDCKQVLPGNTMTLAPWQDQPRAELGPVPREEADPPDVDGFITKGHVCEPCGKKRRAEDDTKVE